MPSGAVTSFTRRPSCVERALNFLPTEENGFARAREGRSTRGATSGQSCPTITRQGRDHSHYITAIKRLSHPTSQALGSDS